MKKAIILALLGVCFVASRVQALEPFVVSDITVRGLERLSPGTVFNYLPIKVGDRIDDVSARDSIRALYRTGFFEDVRLERDGAVLQVVVRERPVIADIKFIGNREFKDDDLTKALQQVDFAVGRIYNESIQDKVVQELKNQYFSKGRYNAGVKVNITPLERNRVSVVFDISEGVVAKIRQINIIGNNAYTEKKLLKRFKLNTGGIFSFFTKSNRYSKQKLSADLESLRSLYQNQGFVDFDIESTQVSISPDKKDIFITIAIHEGGRFRFGKVAVAPTEVVPQADLESLLEMRGGEVYSRKQVADTRGAIADRMADDGYAFATVDAVPNIDRDNHTVSFRFTVNPRQRVYVRRINITGNTSTRDEVIRRETRQFEGGWFSAEKIRRSRERLQRLGFFDDVKIDTPAVPGSDDQVDVDINVKERATGSFLFGVGYSDADGALLQGAYQQSNVFGTGKEVKATIDTSKVNRTIDLSYTNPYYTADGISRTFSIASRRIDATETDTADYIADTDSGSVDFRIPLSEFNSLQAGFGFERVNLKATDLSPPEYAEFIDEHPTNDDFKLNLSFSKDTRDSFLYPSEGSLRRITLEASLPGSDLEYYKASLRGTWYVPLSERLTFKTYGEVGYGDGYGNTDGLPFFENFFAGGASSVRGYDARSLGPKDSGDTPEAIGGSKRVLASMELLFPVLGGGESKDKRMGWFVDAGQVYGSGDSIDFGEVRYSTGLAFYWFSPLGPLSFSFGVPLNDKPGDSTGAIQFTLGTLFR